MHESDGLILLFSETEDEVKCENPILCPIASPFQHDIISAGDSTREAAPFASRQPPTLNMKVSVRIRTIFEI